MTPTETAALILTGVFIMAMIAVAVQTAENQRRERQLQLLAIRNRIRGTEHLLDNLPIEFQTQPLRSLLIQNLRGLWTGAAKLDRSINKQASIQKLDEREKEPFTPPAFPANRLTLFEDRNTAQRNRSLVRETAQLILDLKQQHAIGYDAAQSQLIQLKIAYQRCNCDLLLLEAQMTQGDRGAHVAIHKFRTAAMQLRKININQTLDAQITRLNQHINELEQEPPATIDSVAEDVNLP